MGMIDRFLTRSGGIAAAAEAAGNVAEIFPPSATRRMELDEEAYARAITQAQAEFTQAPLTWWDSLMNGLNRLPRPLLTLGTIGLFVYAMVDPVGFSARMVAATSCAAHGAHGSWLPAPCLRALQTTAPPPRPKLPTSKICVQR